MHTPKVNHLKGNICTCEFFKKASIVDQKIKAKFLKTNVSRIFIMAKRSSISCKLNYGSHVNTLSVNIYVCVFSVCMCVINSA